MYRRLVELQVQFNRITQPKTASCFAMITTHTLYHFAMVDTLGQLRFAVHRLPYCLMVQSSLSF